MENMNNKIDTNAASEQPSQKYTLEYVLEQIEKLSKPDYMQGVHGAPNLIASLNDNGQENEKPRAIAETIIAREKTNRELIAFYQRMYDDLKPKPKQSDIDIDKISELVELANDNPDVAERIGLYDSLEQAIQQTLLFGNLR